MTTDAAHIRILAVEDDDVDYLVLQRALDGCGINASLTRANSVARAAQALAESSFHCVLLDYRLPDGSGLDLLDSDAISGVGKHVAVIMLTGEEDVEIAVTAMKNGAQDYLPKRLIRPETLKIAIGKALEMVDLARQVKESQEKIHELAFFDNLTGLPNRNVFEDRLDQLIRTAKREKCTFLVGIMDMNGFKKINDNLGHQAGDSVLRIVASRLASAMRDSDTVARFGGDEFVVLLPKAEPGYTAQACGQRLLDAIAAPMEVAGEQVHIGMSIGFSEYPVHGKLGKDLIRQADEAMYAAKANGTGWQVAASDERPSFLGATG